MAVSVLFHIDRSGHIEEVDDGPAPAVVVDADGQLHAESGTINPRWRKPQQGAMALAVLKHPGLSL